MGTNSESVYITQATCRGITEPKTAKISRISAKMKQKSPFSLATAAGNRKTAKKRGAPGTHWGGGVAAPRPFWIVWRMAKTCPACSLTRLTDYHRRQPIPGNQYTRTAKGGEIFAPCAKSVFHQKKWFHASRRAARAKKLTHPKPREKKKTEGQKISERGSKFEGAQNLRGEGLKIWGGGAQNLHPLPPANPWKYCLFFFSLWIMIRLY